MAPLSLLLWSASVMAVASSCDRELYLGLLENCLHGDVAAALAGIAALEPEPLRDCVGELLEGRLSPEELKAAAWLHTEAAHFHPDSRAREEHGRAARRLVSRMDGMREAATFTKDWLVLEAIVLQTSARDLDALALAMAPLQQAERLSPRDPLVELALGATLEKAFTLGQEPDLLREAEKHYRQALEAQPGLAEAHLRLGHVLFLREEASFWKEGIEELEWVIRNTRIPDLHYLSHLFRGQWQERRGDSTAAVRSYESAAAASPNGQAALLALSRGLQETGARDEAYDVLLQALALPVSDPGYTDDYRLYRLGLFRWLQTLRFRLRSAVMDGTP